MIGVGTRNIVGADATFRPPFLASAGPAAGNLHARPLRVLMVLPALTETTGPFWRPIKYGLFSPLGLAQLAAFLDPDRDAVRVVDEHVMPELPLDDDTAPPDLVVAQVYITNAHRAYRSPTTTAPAAASWPWGVCTSPRFSSGSNPRAGCGTATGGPCSRRGA